MTSNFGGACPRLGDKRTHSKVWASLELVYNFVALSQDGRDYVRARFLDAVTGDVDDHGKLIYRTSLLYASFQRRTAVP